MNLEVREDGRGLTDDYHEAEWCASLLQTCEFSSGHPSLRCREGGCQREEEAVVVVMSSTEKKDKRFWACLSDNPYRVSVIDSLIIILT